MAKANSVEAEIDEIIIDWETDCRNGKYHHENGSGERILDWPLAVGQLRRQILNAMRCRMIATERPGVFYLHLDFLQAIKNSRRDGDEGKN